MKLHSDFHSPNIIKWDWYLQVLSLFFLESYRNNTISDGKKITVKIIVENGKSYYCKVKYVVYGEFSNFSGLSL